MRWPIPQPCISSRARVLRIRRSSVPRRTSGMGWVLMATVVGFRQECHPALVGSQQEPWLASRLTPWPRARRLSTSGERLMRLASGTAGPALQLLELLIDRLVAEAVGNAGDFLGFLPLHLEEGELALERAAFVLLVHRHFDGESRFQR